MTLGKAIEILTSILQDDESIWDPDGSDAISLLIEAGKRLEDGRGKGYDYFGHPLPGETFD